MALQIRRGTNAERLLIIPLQGELIFTTDTKKLYVGDGTTTGGIAVDTGTGGAGAVLLDELTDVIITSPATGQVLKFNGTNWVNGTDATGGSSITSIDDIPGVVLTTPSSGQVLKFNGSNWVNDTDLNDGLGVIQLNSLTDVVVGSTVTNEVLKYDGINWVNGTISINNLSDVVSLSPSPGDVLSWDGFVWTNTNLSNTLDSLSDVVVGFSATNEVLTYDGTSWVNGNIPIDSLSNVFLVTPTINEVLKYDGTNWSNGNIPIESLSNVSMSAPQTIGQILKYDGLNWVNGDEVFTEGTNYNIGIIADDLSVMVNTATKIIKANIYDINNRPVFNFTTGGISPQVVNTNAMLNLTPAAPLFINSEISSIALVTSDTELFGTSNNLTNPAETTKLTIISSRGTYADSLPIQLGDNVGLIQGSGFNGTDNIVLSGIGFSSSANTLGTTPIPGKITFFIRSDNAGFKFTTIDSTGLFSSTALRTSGVATTELGTFLSKAGGAGFESQVAGTVVYDTTEGALKTYHPTQGWGKVLTSTAPTQLPVYADAAARDAAITSPVAGMMVFVTDVAKFQGYDGTVWANLN